MTATVAGDAMRNTAGVKTSAATSEVGNVIVAKTEQSGNTKSVRIIAGETLSRRNSRERSCGGSVKDFV